MQHLTNNARIKRFIMVFFLTVTLCSCSKNSQTNSKAVSENTASIATESAASDEQEILKEIKQTLSEFKNFSLSYLQCKAYMSGENLDSKDCITIDDKEYCKVTGGDYTTYSSLMSAIDRYCSKDVISECNLKSNNYYQGKDDSLYVWKDADSNGGVMGSDIAYIKSIDIIDKNSVKLNMIAHGDKQEWGYEKDSVIPFEITMKREDNLWKIDKCGLTEMDYITWLFDADYSEQS